MDWFLDRINFILKSLDGLFEDIFEEPYGRLYLRDRDFREAWEELDEFIRLGRFSQREDFAERLGRNAFKSHFADSKGEEKNSRGSKTHRIKINYGEIDLREDYNNLGVSAGASMEDVKKSYKKLLKKYHPDNYPEGSEQQKLATEITKKLNLSYQRIKQHTQNNKI